MKQTAKNMIAAAAIANLAAAIRISQAARKMIAADAITTSAIYADGSGSISAAA